MAKARWLSVHNTAQQFVRQNPLATKAALASHISEHFGLKLARSVYHTGDFAVRFSHAKGSSFSNCVLSLSALQRFDHRPMMVCILRPDSVQTMLMNSSFIRKVSHSSHQLRVDNVKGTILGHDIMREFDGVENNASNFEELFARHSAFTWDDNLVRLVEATNAIVGTGQRFEPTAEQQRLIQLSVERSHTAATDHSTRATEQELLRLIEQRRTRIIEAAAIDNVNLRGNAIEQILTEGQNVHSFEDKVYDVGNGVRALVDIKTKLLNRASSPKMYNIDKILRELADGRTIVAFFFVGVDVEAATVAGRLINILDTTIIAATRVQFHWAGRNSRGVTQLTGDISRVFSPDFQERVNLAEAQAFVQMLLNLRGNAG